MANSRAIDLLFLNGWSLDATFVEPMVQRLAGGASYRIVDIDEQFLVDEWFETLATLVSENTLIVGWSLGGMLAIRLAVFLEQNQRAYRKLITFMSAPSFIVRDGWCSGMSEEDFEHFRNAAQSDPMLIKTFPYLMLCPKGCGNYASKAAQLVDRSLLAELKKRYRASLQGLDTRMATLGLLKQLDLRDALATLNHQAVFVFAEYDQLVPASSADLVRDLYPKHQVCVVEGESHLLSGSIIDSARGLCGLTELTDEAHAGG